MGNGKHGFARLAPVVVGAAVIGAGVLMSAVPASAQWHHHSDGDFGAGLVAGAIALAANPGPAAPVYDEAYAGDCSRKNQRVWDGYGWRVQRVQVCE